jgi:hypothetical protein
MMAFLLEDIGDLLLKVRWNLENHAENKEMILTAMNDGEIGVD